MTLEEGTMESGPLWRKASTDTVAFAGFVAKWLNGVIAEVEKEAEENENKDGHEIISDNVGDNNKDTNNERDSTQNRLLERVRLLNDNSPVLLKVPCFQLLFSCKAYVLKY
eukprot:m.67126 g.67126  ORF g.67126 m.67126 type:complete len:111 (-) comp11861_c0_seq8:602-934(-)